MSMIVQRLRVMRQPLGVELVRVKVDSSGNGQFDVFGGQGAGDASLRLCPESVTAAQDPDDPLMVPGGEFEDPIPGVVKCVWAPGSKVVKIKGTPNRCFIVTVTLSKTTTWQSGAADPIFPDVTPPNINALVEMDRAPLDRGPSRVRRAAAPGNGTSRDASPESKATSEATESGTK